MLEWRARYGRWPSSYDWSRTHARHRGEQALRRLAVAQWPAASVVSVMFGSWALARQVAAEETRSGGRPACLAIVDSDEVTYTSEACGTSGSRGSG
jgi:hypothetical protein